MANKYPIRVENIVQKGEIACHSYISLVRQNAVLCGSGLNKGETVSSQVSLRGQRLRFSSGNG